MKNNNLFRWRLLRGFVRLSRRLDIILVLVLWGLLDFSEEIFGDPVRELLQAFFTLAGFVGAASILLLGFGLWLAGSFSKSRWTRRAATAVFLLSLPIAVLVYFRQIIWQSFSQSVWLSVGLGLIGVWIVSFLANRQNKLPRKLQNSWPFLGFLIGLSLLNFVLY